MGVKNLCRGSDPHFLLAAVALDSSALAYAVEAFVFFFVGEKVVTSWDCCDFLN